MNIESNTLLTALAAAVLLPFVVHDQYLLHLAIMALFYAVLASSLNLVVGYVGEFSLGHTAFLGVGAYTAALLSAKLGFPMWITIPVAGATSAAFGYLIGAITLRLQGPYFVIVTLSFAEVLRLVANNWIGLTNGPMGLAGISQDGIADKRAFFYIVLGIAVLSFYLCYRFVYSNSGRGAVAVRENRYVAQSIGVNPFESAMQAFVLGAFLAGLAGGFYAHYISFVGPEVFQFAFMASMIIMVLIGGKGTLVGPLIGAVIVTLLEEYLREVQQLRLTLFGLIVMAIVLFLPNGLMSLIPRRNESRNVDLVGAAPVKEGSL
ncbi:branched-chain amino acid ABC transporter permease [Pseudorhodoplanes sinuspersici]|uniref:Branched-chain amino acid ABC transporter permease n=1 Tax=Pseudorhodoplanes sinuspersici TaxID=1235591 RepID=A0A1W6ZRB4_9HYPH|nr:branched-chain amino acid ABC transporter permease [Pseudorhodoplanes sinuspersici]ARP99787.1 branched-chain amino acid ABC transporter permease [Pseudorhodoplanes sinuspersici]RKE70784.1 amino acid/amide ABC transporter membrane protein 2 (HAAT family) [Pseudorhodoplanes sinuspersici]